MNKEFTVNAEEIQPLVKSIGFILATYKIIDGGEMVDFMYRDQPDFEGDSGWRFLSGSETQEYADNPDNWGIYDFNTLANHDKSITPYMDLPLGTALERVKGTDTFW
ncbi:MAG TPA: DUF2185 domain-containing protein [Prolixibacteraceae bacterium]|nr:DUF2185 domain-containing protein [Prolixibacteraceae bacterium]